MFVKITLTLTQHKHIFVEDFKFLAATQYCNAYSAVNLGDNCCHSTLFANPASCCLLISHFTVSTCDLRSSFVYTACLSVACYVLTLKIFLTYLYFFNFHSSWSSVMVAFVNWNTCRSIKLLIARPLLQLTCR